MEASKKDQPGLVAVIIGVEGYKDLPPLQCAVNDAVYMQETLKKAWQGISITIKTLILPSPDQEKVLNQKATWGIQVPGDAHEVTPDNIIKTLRHYSGIAREFDTFLFFFAGHGKLTDNEPALITVASGQTAHGTVPIKIKEIQDAAAHCRAQNKIMILDCCQTSTQRKKTEEGYKNLKELTIGWSILISSSPGEVSMEDRFYGDHRDDYLQQGVFTACLADGLRNEAVGSSGAVTLADLAHYVGKRVPEEYRQRLEVRVLNQELPEVTNTRGDGFMAQNPVLLTNAVALDGPYKIIIAPVIVPTAHDSRRKWPSKQFLKYWFRYQWVKFPILFPFRILFLCAAFLYAFIIMSTLYIQFPPTIPFETRLPVLSFAGIGSVVLWFTTLHFAIAVNEDRWHPGGYGVLLLYYLCHCIILCFFIYTCGIQELFSTINRIGSVIYLVIELFMIWGLVVIYNCNAAHAIIALAEPLRTDDRREIRQAIRAFQQFKYKTHGVDLSNFIPNISIRPDQYFYIWRITILIIILNTLVVLLTWHVDIVRICFFLIRNICATVLVTWLFLWYHAAFKYIQRQLYKL